MDCTAKTCKLSAWVDDNVISPNWLPSTMPCIWPTELQALAKCISLLNYACVQRDDGCSAKAKTICPLLLYLRHLEFDAAGAALICAGARVASSSHRPM